MASHGFSLFGERRYERRVVGERDVVRSPLRPQGRVVAAAASVFQHRRVGTYLVIAVSERKIERVAFIIRGIREKKRFLINALKGLIQVIIKTRARSRGFAYPNSSVWVMFNQRAKRKELLTPQDLESACPLFSL